MTTKAIHRAITEEMTIWLVEDNERFRSGIRDLINEAEELACVLAVSSCEDALMHLATDAAPDVMLTEVHRQAGDSAFGGNHSFGYIWNTLML